MDFSKYEASGNDFILIEGTSGKPVPEKERISLLCDRHLGVGADGVIVLLESDVADLKMRIFNSDGSEAEMCGNGIRALSFFALELGIVKAGEMNVETNAGTRTVKDKGEKNGSRFFEVEMGEPAWKRAEIPMTGKGDEPAISVPVEVSGADTISATCVSMGNPHCVLFVEDIDRAPVDTLGPTLERHRLFPRRTNVEFVQVVGKRHLTARVWERGVGETLACGTGACAALVAARLKGVSGSHATVSLPGGDLEVVWVGGIVMTGPARHVFDGKTVI